MMEPLFQHIERRESGLVSLALHGCAVTLLFTALSKPSVQVTLKKAQTLFMPSISVYTPKTPTLRGGGGGGDRSLLPASKGQAPKLAARQFTPPAVVTNTNPKLIMDPTLIGPPDVQIANNHMDVWGDPLARL